MKILSPWESPILSAVFSRNLKSSGIAARYFYEAELKYWSVNNQIIREETADALPGDNFFSPAQQLFSFAGLSK
jgi:hypothetical protein